MNRPPRRSIPTKGLARYLDQTGWRYVMPDFDRPDHSIIEWNGESEPHEPAANDNEGELLCTLALLMAGEYT